MSSSQRSEGSGGAHVGLGGSDARSSRSSGDSGGARGGSTRSVRRAGGGSAQRMDRVPGMKRGPRRAVPVSGDGVCVVLERWAPGTGCHTFGCARAHNIASSRGVRAVMWESMGCCCSGEGSFGSMTLSGHLRGVVVWRVCVWGAELFVARVVVSVLASVLASAVSDREGGGIGTVRARQWCACGHERWLGWFVRLLQAREQVCYVGCYPCKTRSVIVT